MGGRIFLKKGVVPHIFNCQHNKEATTAPSTQRIAKRQRKNLVNELLQSASQPMDVLQPDECESSQSDATNNILVKENLISKDISEVKPKIHWRSKSTYTNPKFFHRLEVGCNAVPSTVDASTQTDNTAEPSSYTSANLKENKDWECYEESENTCDPDFVIECEDNSDFEPEIDLTEEKVQIRNCMTAAVKRESEMCLGIPQHLTFVLDFLASKTDCPPLHVIITLKKIRMNDSSAYLAMLFGMSTSSICRIFKKTVFRLASVLQNFIVWPESNIIKQCMPIAFRARYGNTQSIIDCFEVKIEKPLNPLHQSLTWSEYKKANTLKYLISCTPDGTISFVSRGYGGRSSDACIVEDSGYLDNLIPEMDVMADRGFKNIAQLLQRKNCILVRPPSVTADTPMTAEEVRDSKRISALRIHVERVIGRIRYFNMCSPNACIDKNHFQTYDYVIIVSCGLINLHSKLIRN